MNFFQDLVELLKSELASHGYDVSASASDESIVRGYLGVLHRSIPAKPRKVLESAELVCPANLAAGYAEVKRKAVAGESLIPHQSRLLDDIDYSDPLLNDWGIHHLHLGTTVESHGYVTRTGPLFFARTTDDCLYAIQIYEHGAWSKREIVEILHRNWPGSIEAYRLKGIVGLQVQYTEQDIKNLRQAGVQPLIQVDQAVYAPIGGGIMMSGDSMRVIQTSIDIVRMCRQLEQLTVEFVRREASRSNSLPSSNFRLTRKGNRAIVMEESTKLDLFSIDWLISRDLQ